MKRLPGKEADLAGGRRTIDYLKDLGIGKLNFVGGEPLLHPRLTDFCKHSKENSFTTSIVTNAFFLSKTKLLELRPWLDWVGVSIDSSQEEVEKNLGRGRGDHVRRSLEVCSDIRTAGLKLKVNTVVTKLNYTEDMRPLIGRLAPQRWKVFQMLVIRGQNDLYANLLAPSQQEFEQFIQTNSKIILPSGKGPTFESSDEMINSYLILAPDGSVIINRNHEYELIPLESLTKSNLATAVSFEAFVRRGGKYEW